MKTGRFDKFETLYIQNKYTIMSDIEIAADLDRDVGSITRKRRAMGLHKGARGKTDVEERPLVGKKPEGAIYDSLLDEDTVANREILSKLSEVDKKRFFKRMFENTVRYEELKETLSSNELERYSEKYISYISEFETLLKTEEDTLHMAIMEYIRAHRTLVRQKQLIVGIANGTVPANSPGIDMLNSQYKECLDTYNKLMKNLSATREQRLKAHKEDSFSLATVVQALQDKDIRERVGREAAIIAAAGEKAKEAMKTQGLLWSK